MLTKDITNKFKHLFSSLTKTTNNLRDIDVYLLTRDEYLEILPPQLKAGFKLFLKKLENIRDKELNKVISNIDNFFMKEVVNSIMDFLNSDSMNYRGPNSDISALFLSKKIIYRKYQKILDTAKNIDSAIPDSKLHKLRIECKKLRYLIEFFSSLYAQTKIVLIIRQLKELQDKLGVFNDLSVQQEKLFKTFEQIKHENNDKTNIFASCGGLITYLYQKQRNVRTDIFKALKIFMKKEIVYLFRELFNKKANDKQGDR